MEQALGVAPRIDKKEIWEVEEWGRDEWAEQALAEIAFAKAVNIQYVPKHENLEGNVAGYRVRRASNGLALVPSDSDEDIFVGVAVDKDMRRAAILGWMRGSEGKLPSSIKAVVGSFPRRPCTILKSSRARNGCGQCYHFKRCNPSWGPPHWPGEIPGAILISCSSRLVQKRPILRLRRFSQLSN
jgi:hypothetical protein